MLSNVVIFTETPLWRVIIPVIAAYLLGNISPSIIL